MRNLGGFFMLVFWSCAVPDTYQKQALRFEDQLALLQQRGLEFDDLDRALSQIRAISYCRLSGAPQSNGHSRQERGRMPGSVFAC